MTTEAKPHLSGWCSPCCSPKAHATCQGRLDKGLLNACECAGHSPTEPLADVGSAWENGATTNSAPGGASTPKSQGLADYQGVD